MSDYEYARDELRLAIYEASIADGHAAISIKPRGRPGFVILVEPDERQAAAQALAGDEWRVVPRAGALPPLYLVDDLWQALGGDPADFDDWHAQHGSADTWGQLLAIVRRTHRPVCGKPVDGEFCVLTAPRSESDMHVCHGPSDVGNDDLPPIPAALFNRPESIDPADVKVGDVVEVEAADGSWLVRGEVVTLDSQSTPYRLRLRMERHGHDGLWPRLTDATVRLVRRAEPDPDPEQVEALWNLGHELGQARGEPLLDHEECRQLIRRGVTVERGR